MLRTWLLVVVPASSHTHTRMAASGTASQAGRRRRRVWRGAWCHEIIGEHLALEEKLLARIAQSVE